MTRHRTTITAGLLALGLLAGCSNSEPENGPAETSETSNAVDSAPVAKPEPAPSVAEQPTGLQPPVVVPDAAPKPVAPDAQVLEDADATGMTARARRDEPTDEETPAASEPTPDATPAVTETP